MVCQTYFETLLFLSAYYHQNCTNIGDSKELLVVSEIQVSTFEYIWTISYSGEMFLQLNSYEQNQY